MSAATRSGSRAEDVLAGLDEEQRTAAQAVTGPVCIRLIISRSQNSGAHMLWAVRTAAG